MKVEHLPDGSWKVTEYFRWKKDTARFVSTPNGTNIPFQILGGRKEEQKAVNASPLEILDETERKET
jgi:hypothetical protein